MFLYPFSRCSVNTIFIFAVLILIIFSDILILIVLIWVVANIDKKLFKSIILIITYCVGLVAVLLNFRVIWKGIETLAALLMPVFIGFCIAFILNRPYKFIYSFIENLYVKFISKLKRKNKKTSTSEHGEKKVNSAVKVISLILIYALFLLFVALIISMICPQLGDSLTKVYDNISTYVSNLVGLSEKIEEFVHVDGEIIDVVTSWLTGIVKGLPDRIPEFIPNIFDVTKSVASSLTNFLLGFIMSVYMLASKEMLIRQIERLFHAFVPKKLARIVIHILEIANDIFGNFVNGRIYDALIVGLLCFIGMSIFGFEYSLLITVLVAVTNVIPVFGPFIGAIPSIFLLLMVDPMQAVFFTVFIIVLQQIDGNIIGPKVVGDSIGLPAWWVMFSILMGGGFGGVFGMLAGVPVFAVIYQLLSEIVNARGKEKKSVQSYEDSD